MSDSVAEILERLARVEAALAAPARDNNPRLGPDCQPPTRHAVRPDSTGPPLPIDPDLEAQDRRLPTVAVAARYGVVVRTVERWLGQDELNFPRPVWINRRKYWWLSQLREWDHARGCQANRKTQ